MPTASIHTLGCRLNQADAAIMAEVLRRAGYRILGRRDEAADLIVINSCTVTGEAARKTGQALRAARRRAPHAFIVLAGCEVDVHADAWRSESVVDLVIPNALKMELPRLLPDGLVRSPKPLVRTAKDNSGGRAGFEIPVSGFYPHRTRANLKVQEGCDFFCSFCIVPYARGRPRSRDWDDALREARALIERGHRELVLTGVNLMLYRDEERGLPELLEALCKLRGAFRIRLSSVEPGPGLERLVNTMAAAPNVCRSLHLPLQYGDDRMLRDMNRRYTTAEFAEFVRYAHDRIPGVCLGTDVIVGFPGEDDASFDACVSCLDGLPLAYFHVFTYSPRDGTPAAARSNRPDGRVTAARCAALRELSNKKGTEFARQFLGDELTVLVEGRTATGGAAGWSDNYLRVEIVDGGTASVSNRFIRCRAGEVLGPRRVTGAVLDAGQTGVA